MNNGQALASVIKAELNGLALSIQQQAKYQAIIKTSGGDFEPDDFELAIFDVKLMIVDEKIDDLLSLLKQCPLNGGINADHIIYCTELQDGTVIKDKTMYFDADRDFIEGRRKISEAQLKRWLENAPKMSKTAFAKVLEGFEERRLQRLNKPIVYDESPIEDEARMPTPMMSNVVPDEVEPKIYADIGDEDGVALGEADEFHHNEPSKGWVNRPPKENKDDE